jgi:hypothetical protein
MQQLGVLSEKLLDYTPTTSPMRTTRLFMKLTMIKMWRTQTEKRLLLTSTILTSFMSSRKTSLSRPLSMSDVVHIEVATMCHDGNTPLKTYAEILRWAQRSQPHNLHGNRFPVDAPHHETFLLKLFLS